MSDQDVPRAPQRKPRASTPSPSADPLAHPKLPKTKKRNKAEPELSSEDDGSDDEAQEDQEILRSHLMEMYQVQQLGSAAEHEGINRNGRFKTFPALYAVDINIPEVGWKNKAYEYVFLLC